MRSEIIIQRQTDERAFNISNLVGNLTWTTDLAAQPGKLTFDCLEDPTIIPHYGDIIRFRYQNQNVFFGRIFTKTRNQSGRMSVVAYDQMRYLQNKDTYTFAALPSSAIFRRICQDHGLRFRVVDQSPFNVARKIHDGKSLFDIINDALERTDRDNDNARYFIRDNFGTLEHIHMNRLQTGLVFGDRSRATSFNFQGSIDSGTYNRIQLIRDASEDQRRQVIVAQHATNMRMWGKLQHHEKVDDDMNTSQMRRTADRLLRQKNRPSRSLKVDALGDTRIQAGNGIILSIARLRNEGLSNQQRVLVTGCSHKFSSASHIMSLTLEVR